MTQKEEFFGGVMSKHVLDIRMSAGIAQTLEKETKRFIRDLGPSIIGFLASGKNLGDGDPLNEAAVKLGPDFFKEYIPHIHTVSMDFMVLDAALGLLGTEISKLEKTYLTQGQEEVNAALEEFLKTVTEFRNHNLLPTLR